MEDFQSVATGRNACSHDLFMKWEKIASNITSVPVGEVPHSRTRSFWGYSKQQSHMPYGIRLYIRCFLFLRFFLGRGKIKQSKRAHST